MTIRATLHDLRSWRPRPAGGAACLLALGALLGTACHGPAQRARSRPNVLLVVIDTLRADRLHCYGAPRRTSPHIDALAAQGVLFERAYAAAPWTLPAVASLLTATYPSWHGVRDSEGVESRLSEDSTTLPEVLQQAGYETRGYSSHPWISPQFGFGQGFAADAFRLLREGNTDSPKDDAAVTRHAVRWLRGRPRANGQDRPFFLYLHYMGPHTPYAPRRREVEALLGRMPDRPSFSGWLAELPPERYYNELRRGATDGRLTPADRDYQLDLYDTEVSNVDRHLGRVLDTLAETGREQDTLVVVTADHGEAFLEHRSMGHADQLYPELLHVPWVMTWPGRAPGRVAEPVHQVDVMPTILDIVGVPSAAALHGVSRARPGEPATGFAEASQPDPRRQMKLMRGRYSYIADLGDESRDELYDVGRDPGETRNLVREHEPLRARLRREVVEFRRRSEKGSQGLRRTAPVVDPATAEHLRALGYVQ
jgi:arylsulfatase A-like enzyme